MSDVLNLMTLNIGNPSIERVKKQIEWIEQRKEDVFVLTETKDSKGCSFLEQYFGGSQTSFFDISKETKYNVYFPRSITGDLGVMILSKFPIIKISNCFDQSDRYYSRFLDILLDFKGKNIGIIGLYVPSRDASEEKIIRKKQFITDLCQYIKSREKDKKCPYIVCGDLNILERNHVPHYSTFKKWEYDFYDYFQHFGFLDAFRLLHPSENEYSWVGRTNDGYRYDHIFISKELQKQVIKCAYVHETRTIPITDHSAMILQVSM